MKKFLVLFWVIVSLLSCGDSQTAKEQGQQHKDNVLDSEGKGTHILRQALAIHDEAMQQMSEIARFRRQISLEAGKPNANIPKLKALEAQLAAADQSMLDWMHTFKKPINPEDSIEYLHAKKNDIERTQKMMNDAVAAAKQQFKEEDKK